MTSIHSQRGSTLLVALIMLVLLTLIAVSAMSSTTASIQIVGNAQFRKEATNAGQRALETVLSNKNFLSAVPANQNIDINQDSVPDYTVTFDNPALGVSPPRCISYMLTTPSDPGLPIVCTAASDLPVVCYWTIWDITAGVTSVSTGTNVILHQGVRTVAGLNDAVAFCGV